MCKRSTDLLLPPPSVFYGVCVDRFIASAVCLAIRLVVSGEVDPSGCDPPGAGDFQIALLAGRPLYSNVRTLPTLTERTVPAVVTISVSVQRRAQVGEARRSA